MTLILVSIPLAVLYAEIIGYFVHILLHSEKVPSLSTAHMLHHLRDYGPQTKLHRETYLASTHNRKSFIGGIGFEWIAPIGLIVGLSFGLLHLLNVPAIVQAVFLVVGIAWGYIAFDYMHSAMHLSSFWMLKNRFFRAWFMRVRRMHDIHHNNVAEDGRMLTNFGISFYGFDRLFGTFTKRITENSKLGFEAAEKRYSYIYE